MILFGAGAQVNVGGLVASTANITNGNFMAGVDRFDQPGNASAMVENRGDDPHRRWRHRGVRGSAGEQHGVHHRDPRKGLLVGG